MTGCGCRFCTDLQRLAIRRRDAQLAEAAIRLREEHAENEAEHMAFARSSAQRTRLGNGMGRTRAGVGFELPITAVSSKTRLPDGRHDA